MRLPKTARTSRPWRVHELTQDFRIEDVWALPTPGGADDFRRLVHLIASGDPVARLPALSAHALGDPVESRRADRVGQLRRRLRGADAPRAIALPFTSLYLLDDEWAAEIVNRTMRGVMHVGWVPDGTGGYRGQLAVYVKPNGLLGPATWLRSGHSGT